jgi:hypothetical protein
MVGQLRECPFTTTNASELANFLRASAEVLIHGKGPEERAELEITLEGFVARLQNFSGTFGSPAVVRRLEPLKQADHVVKILMTSGLLRNRSGLKRALCLGLDATLPHWTC